MNHEDPDLQEVELIAILECLSDEAKRMLLGAARGLLKADAALARGSGPASGLLTNMPTLH